MSYWKDTLCFFVVLVIWGIVGHFDYEEAVALEKASHKQALPSCPQPDRGAPKSARVRSSSAIPAETVLDKPKRYCATNGPREALP